MSGLLSDRFQEQVSIPNRDFGELQYKSLHTLAGYSLVSIPNRDFGELQLEYLLAVESESSTFQSLIGILVNCN